METQRDTVTDEEGYHGDDNDPNAIKIRETDSRVGSRITHLQLILAILARACPPSMQLRTQKHTPFVTKSRLGSMTP